MNYKKVAELASWTFLETFLAVAAAGFGGVAVGDWPALKALGVTAAISAVAACVSVIKSVIVAQIGAVGEPTITY